MAQHRPRVITEDLGKVCEMAFCLLANTPYQGTYRYSMEKAEELKNRFKELEPEFKGMKHTGTLDDLYDFTHESNPDLKMSIKSNKTGYMVCPQGGQGTKKTFCEKFNLLQVCHTDPAMIKAFVVAETPRILNEFINYFSTLNRYATQILLTGLKYLFGSLILKKTRSGMNQLPYI